jgi:putative membrane protein
MMMWHHSGGGDWVAMSVVMVAFVGILVATVGWLLQSLRRGSDRAGAAPPPSWDRADDVLAERFARGEIDESEFTRSRDLLHSTTSAG